jgi:hypothetical protein
MGILKKWRLIFKESMDLFLNVVTNLLKAPCELTWVWSLKTIKSLCRWISVGFSGYDHHKVGHSVATSCLNHRLQLQLGVLLGLSTLRGNRLCLWRPYSCQHSQHLYFIGSCRSSWLLDCWATPRGRYDEYSSKVFLQLRNQGVTFRRRADNTTEGDADWLSNTPTRAPFNDTCWLVFGQ